MASLSCFVRISLVYWLLFSSSSSFPPLQFPSLAIACSEAILVPASRRSAGYRILLKKLNLRLPAPLFGAVQDLAHVESFNRMFSFST